MPMDTDVQQWTEMPGPGVGGSFLVADMAGSAYDLDGAVGHQTALGAQRQVLPIRVYSCPLVV